MNNEQVRAAAKKARIPLWRIANHLKISEPTMTRWLRVPLSPEKEKRIMDAINTIAKEGS